MDQNAPATTTDSGHIPVFLLQKRQNPVDSFPGWSCLLASTGPPVSPSETRGPIGTEASRLPPPPLLSLPSFRLPHLDLMERQAIRPATITPKCQRHCANVSLFAHGRGKWSGAPKPKRRTKGRARGLRPNAETCSSKSPRPYRRRGQKSVACVTSKKRGIEGMAHPPTNRKVAVSDQINQTGIVSYS